MFTTEQAVVDMVSSFKPSKVLILHGKGKALVEFPDACLCEDAMTHLNRRNPGTALKSATGEIKDGFGCLVDGNGKVIISSATQKPNGKIIKMVIKNSVFPVCLRYRHVSFFFLFFFF